jgi:hypothetical protein
MKISSTPMLVPLLALAVSPLSVEVAIANDCQDGFYKGDVSGTPPTAGSSFTCTTKVIECPAPMPVTTVLAMVDRKAITPAYNQAQFSYTCTYEPPIK